ncbi:hypothetical protein H072_1455 [Dactylellina haptotyla CBS 200.50]|uniref:Uncharacterized protein n=1 Tax=Dactylellina haptotyla (strain CBS 200.50) TaxID=1284197 RepID=S8CA45_DACHA|nr:hypothetical protein H072_1455 [Dactylellina haptotyla CBS 200.50]
MASQEKKRLQNAYGGGDGGGEGDPGSSRRRLVPGTREPYYVEGPRARAGRLRVLDWLEKSTSEQSYPKRLKRVKREATINENQNPNVASGDEDHGENVGE